MSCGSRAKMGWSDLMIDYYKSEAIRGWTFYQAAMLERHQTHLRDSYTMDYLNVKTRRKKSPKLIIALGAELNQEFIHSETQFEDNVRRLRNGEPVDDLPAIDPSLPFHQIQLFIERKLGSNSTKSSDACSDIDEDSGGDDPTKVSTKSFTASSDGVPDNQEYLHSVGETTSASSGNGGQSVELMFRSDDFKSPVRTEVMSSSRASAVGTVDMSDSRTSAVGTVDISDSRASVVRTVDMSDSRANAVGTVDMSDSRTSAVGTMDMSDSKANAVGTVDMSDSRANAVGTVDMSDSTANAVGTEDMSDSTANAVGTEDMSDSRASVVGTEDMLDSRASAVGTVDMSDSTASVVGTVDMSVSRVGKVYADESTQTSSHLVHMATQNTVDLHDKATQCSGKVDRGQQMSVDLSQSGSELSHLGNVSGLLNEDTKKRFCSERSSFSSTSTTSELSDLHDQPTTTLTSNHSLSGLAMLSNPGTYLQTHQTPRIPSYGLYNSYQPSRQQFFNAYAQQQPYMYYASVALAPSFASQQSPNIVYQNSLAAPSSSSVLPDYTLPLPYTMNRCFGRPVPRYDSRAPGRAEPISSTTRGASAMAEQPVAQEADAAQHVKPKTVSAPSNPAVEFADHKTSNVSLQDINFEWVESDTVESHGETEGHSTSKVEVTDLQFGTWDETDGDHNIVLQNSSSFSQATLSPSQATLSPSQATLSPSQATLSPSQATLSSSQSLSNQRVPPTDQELKLAKKAARKLRKQQKKAAQNKTELAHFLADQPECIICLKDLLPSERYQLECGHDSFHKECVSEWLTERSRTCPACRCQVTDSY